MKSERNLVYIQPGYKDHKNFQCSVWDSKFQRRPYSAPIITICTAYSGIVERLKTQNQSRTAQHQIITSNSMSATDSWRHMPAILQKR